MIGYYDDDYCFEFKIIGVFLCESNNDDGS